MIDETRGAFTYRSSTLAGLADSGPFRGLLLTVLGSRSDFLGLWTPRCAYVHDINTRHFGRFWPISWTITHRFGIPERLLMVAEPQHALTCHSSTLSVLPDSVPFHGLLLTILVSLCDFLAC